MFCSYDVLVICEHYLSKAVFVLMAITHSSPQDFNTVHCKHRINIVIIDFVYTWKLQITKFIKLFL